MRGHMEYPCPECGAKPLEPCVTDGQFADAHDARIELRDSLEYTCDECGEHAEHCRCAHQLPIDAATAREMTRMRRLWS